MQRLLPPLRRGIRVKSNYTRTLAHHSPRSQLSRFLCLVLGKFYHLLRLRLTMLNAVGPCEASANIAESLFKHLQNHRCSSSLRIHNIVEQLRQRVDVMQLHPPNIVIIRENNIIRHPSDQICAYLSLDIHWLQSSSPF